MTIAGTGFERNEAAAAPLFLYDAAMQAADGGPGELAISIRQIGDHGLSRPAEIVLD